MAKSIQPTEIVGALTDDQFAGIGRVMVAWSLLEWIVHTAFCALIRPGSWQVTETKSIILPASNDRGMYLAAEIRQIDRLLNIMREFVPESWSEADRTDFASLTDEIRLLQQERHDLAHAVWSMSLTEPDVAHGDFRLRAKAQKRIRKTREDLNELAKRINGIGGELAWLIFYRPRAAGAIGPGRVRASIVAED